MTEPTTTGNIYTYRRISHAEERSGSASVQWQEKVIDQWLTARGRCREDGWIDDGTSASISLEDREGGKRLLAAAVNRGDVILVARMDRLFRDVEDFRIAATSMDRPGSRASLMHRGPRLHHADGQDDRHDPRVGCGV